MKSRFPISDFASTAFGSEAHARREFVEVLFPIESNSITPSPRPSIGNWQSDFGAASRAAIGNWQSEIGNRPSPAPSLSKGFTLVELMISLAMVLILILGINFVFRSATDAIGAGQALNGINADAQSSQPVLFDDLRNVSKNPPCFIIASQLVTQFLNADDAKTSSDPTVIVTDNNGGQVKIGNGLAPNFISPALLNSRNHRADMLKFFAHGLYHRRTGPDGTFYATDTSNDAYIEYGHAALPSNDLTSFYGPSNLPNVASQTSSITGLPGVPRVGAYASDWVLTRRVTLLKDPTTIPPLPSNPASDATDPYYPATGTPIQYAPPGTTSTAFAVNMAPFSYGSPSNNPTDNASSPPQNQFQSSRYDLAGVTPEVFDRIIANAILGWQSGGFTGNSLWWNPLVYSFQMVQSPANTSNPQMFSQTSPAIPPYISYFSGVAPDYTGMPPLGTGKPSTNDPGLWLARAQCNPSIQTPVTAASLAQLSPYFLQHCSQFIVEYAGDYMQQDNNPTDLKYGAMTGMGPDGQIDFYVDASGNKHIRWYGMPRSTTGVPHPGDKSGALVLIRGFDPTIATVGGSEDPTAAGTTPGNAPLNYFTDVIPLRDYYTMWRDYYQGGTPTNWTAAPPWEVDVNFDPTRDYGSYIAIPKPNTPTTSNQNAFNNPTNPPRYVAAWHDDMPAMIRILVKVDDPNNKVKDGPWYEYVFRLK